MLREAAGTGQVLQTHERVAIVTAVIASCGMPFDHEAFARNTAQCEGVNKTTNEAAAGVGAL